MLTCGINGNVIRLLPPLVITDDELNEALAVLKEIIVEESAGGTQSLRASEIADNEPQQTGIELLQSPEWARLQPTF